MFDLTVNHSNGVDIDACGDTALASSQVLREGGVHVLLGSSHQAALVHHSQPRDEEVWVEAIRNAPSPVAAQKKVRVSDRWWSSPHQDIKTRQWIQTPRLW